MKKLSILILCTILIMVSSHFPPQIEDHLNKFMNISKIDPFFNDFDKIFDHLPLMRNITFTHHKWNNHEKQFNEDSTSKAFYHESKSVDKNEHRHDHNYHKNKAVSEHHRHKSLCKMFKRMNPVWKILIISLLIIFSLLLFVCLFRCIRKCYQRRRNARRERRALNALSNLNTSNTVMGSNSSPYNVVSNAPPMHYPYGVPIQVPHIQAPPMAYNSHPVFGAEMGRMNQQRYFAPNQANNYNYPVQGQQNLGNEERRNENIYPRI